MLTVTNMVYGNAMLSNIFKYKSNLFYKGCIYYIMTK